VIYSYLVRERRPAPASAAEVGGAAVPPLVVADKD